MLTILNSLTSNLQILLVVMTTTQLNKYLMMPNDHKIPLAVSAAFHIVRSFVLSGVAVGCWQSFDVPSAHRQR